MMSEQQENEPQAAEIEPKTEAPVIQEEPKLAPSKTFTLFWAGIPGQVLRVPLGIALSDDLAREREELAVLSIDERLQKNPLYKVQMLADVLEGRPENFPGFPIYEIYSDITEEEFYKQEFVKYFSQRDSRGRRIFQRFIERLYNDYWDWALPNPIFPASESLLNLLVSSMKDSES
jgi:hypothetical protein